MEDAGYGRHSRWRATAALDDGEARERAAGLERRGRSLDEIQIRAAYLDLLDLTPGQRVLVGHVRYR